MIGILLFISCDKDEGPLETGTDPEIVSTRIAANWNLLSQAPAAVEVTVKDPQGNDNIRGVRLEVRDDGGNTVFKDSLYDDGGVVYPDARDVFARDGVFRNRFNVSDISSLPGVYRFRLQAEDRDAHASAVLEREVRFGANTAPEIVKIASPDSLPSGSDGRYIYAAVYDENGTDEVEQVRFDLYRNTEKVTALPVEMSNSGDTEQSGDLFAGDSVFSYKMDSSFAAGRKGRYELRFSATDGFGDTGPETSGEIYLDNKPGRILEIFLADSLEKPDNPAAVLFSEVRVRVSDPQGLADVDSVYFLSLKPDGEYANSGAPFPMVDNGLPFNQQNFWVEAGDATAGDGIYTLTIGLSGNPATLLGTYVYTFYMRDKAGNLANVMQDSIEVY